MTLHRKIRLLTTVWLICIVLFVDAAVFILFVRTALRNETMLLQGRAERMVLELGTAQLLRPDQEKLLVKYLPSNAMIRILDRSGSELSMLTNDPHVATVPREPSSQAGRTISRAGRLRILTVRVPLQLEGMLVGTIEFAERLDSVQSNVRMLVAILFFTTGIAVFGSMLGGNWLTRTILKPVTNLTKSMRAIESSLAFQPMPLPAEKDELYELTTTFNHMIGRIDESFARQQQFVSDASHELRTALTIIEGYASMLRRWGDREENVRKEAIESIYQEAVRLKKMTRQMLHAALSGEADGETTQGETVRLDELCRQVARPFRFIHRRDVRVEAEADLTLRTDPNKLKQLLLILLDNAVKYSRRDIALRARKTAGGVRIEVEDRGIGIPSQELGRVFDRFYRVDKARHRKTGGTGLGLSIARSLAEQMGGRLELESKENVGTTFTLTLPAFQDAEEKEDQR